jgi:hypothetical protein
VEVALLPEPVPTIPVPLGPTDIMVLLETAKGADVGTTGAGADMAGAETSGTPAAGLVYSMGVHDEETTLVTENAVGTTDVLTIVDFEGQFSTPSAQLVTVTTAVL